MPAHRLPDHPALSVPKYAVVGMYSTTADGGFVQHVALLQAEQALAFNLDNVPVWHMGPPLVAGEQSRRLAPGHDVCPKVHVVGTVALDADDMEGISTWLADVEKEDRRPYGSERSHWRQYVVLPHMEWFLAPEAGRRLYRRFSCGGFVLECYRAASINLIDSPRAELPPVEMDLLAGAYHGELGERETLRRHCGIPGQGPWPILLAGYLLHALSRSNADVRNAPYCPRSVDEARFPLARQESSTT